MVDVRCVPTKLGSTKFRRAIFNREAVVLRRRQSGCPQTNNAEAVLAVHDSLRLLQGQAQVPYMDSDQEDPLPTVDLEFVDGGAHDAARIDD